jgi:phosphoribosylaminoimidazolecarboxamide formyltransferase / IMP cyclohydrolase
MQKTALFSVSDKDGLVSFAKKLRNLNFRFLGSSGTAAYLNNAGIACLDIAEIVGKPILGHRVVTLSREIHAGLLAQNNKKDRAELKKLGVPFIDLVYVNFYPLEAEIDRPGRSLESVIEKTDIGGPTILRSAAKGRRWAISDPNQFDMVLSFLKGEMGNSRRDKDKILSTLAGMAEWRVSEYCKMSSNFHEKFATGRLLFL